MIFNAVPKFRKSKHQHFKKDRLEDILIEYKLEFIQRVPPRLSWVARAH